MGQVLVYYDGGELSKKALRKAVDSFDPEQDELILVMVVPSAKLQEFEDTAPDISVAEARDIINDAVERLKADGIQALGLVQQGNPVKEIVEIGNRLKVKTIVVPDEPNKKIGRFVIGNLSEMVMRSSERPVLVVK